MQKEVRRFRRGTGRREELGGAVQGQAAGAAVSGDTDAAGAADHAGDRGKPFGDAAAGAGGYGRIPGGGETVRVRERERIAVRVLRLRPGRGSLSGRGVRRDLLRRGHAAEGAVDAEAGGVRARRERISQAHLLHVQPGRAGAWVYQAAVYRPAV